MSSGLYKADLLIICESDGEEMSVFVFSGLGGMTKSPKYLRHSPSSTSADNAHDRRRVENNTFIRTAWERPCALLQ